MVLVGNDPYAHCFRGSSVCKVVELANVPPTESNPRWIDVLVVMLQGQKSVRIDKITVLRRFWAEMILMPIFFSGSSAGEVVEHEKLPRTEPIGNMHRMLLVVNKHRKVYWVV
jgi:hypothetical protein